MKLVWIISFLFHFTGLLCAQNHLCAVCDGEVKFSDTSSRRQQANDWLSGSTAFDDWYGNEIPALEGFLPAGATASPIVSKLIQKPAIQAALTLAKSATLSADLTGLDVALQSGQIRTHHELRRRLDLLGPWALPQTNQVKVPPLVACAWGTEPLRAGLLRRAVGHLDFTFPPGKFASASSATARSASARRRIVVTCPHAMDSGCSFSNLRALAWTDGLPVFGIRPALDTSAGKAGANDLWQSQTTEADWRALLDAGRHRIEELCAEQGIDIAAVTLVGFSLGATNAVRLAEAWPEGVDSGISIGSSAIPPRPASTAKPLPWLTIRAYGDGYYAGPALDDFFAERAAENTSPTLELNTSPDFRFKENYAFAWRHLDTRLQSALARAFIRDLPPNRPIAPPDEATLAALHAHLSTFTPRIEPVHSPDTGELLAAAITPTGAPRGLVISLPSSTTSPDDTWPVELGWWGEKHWAAIIAPGATPATLHELLAWVKSHPSWSELPCYLVLYESSSQSATLWPDALTRVNTGQVRALGWIPHTNALYQSATAAQTWTGPVGVSGESPPFRLFISDGAQLPPGALAPQDDLPVVVVAASEPVLNPSVEAAWLALSRIFRADTLGLKQTPKTAP